MNTNSIRLSKIGVPALSRGFAVLLTFALALIGSTARAQVPQQLLGRVTDQTGAVVPDATVTITDEGTGVAITAQTGQTGDWAVPYLRPDSYTIKVEKVGFKVD